MHGQRLTFRGATLPDRHPSGGKVQSPAQRTYGNGDHDAVKSLGTSVGNYLRIHTTLYPECFFNLSQSYCSFKVSSKGGAHFLARDGVDRMIVANVFLQI